MQAKLRAARALEKRNVDEHREDAQFEVSDLVWLYTPLANKKNEPNPKYRPPWVGPMRVLARRGEVNYELKDLHTGDTLQSSPHVSRLKRYHPREGRPQDPPTDLPKDDKSVDWDKESYLARINQLAVDEEPWEALVPPAAADSTIPEDLAIAKEQARVPDIPSLEQLFEDVHKLYHEYIAKRKPDGQNGVTWSAKVARTTKSKLMYIFNKRISKRLVTTERCTHWMQAIKDIREVHQLERFMRSMLSDFRRTFAVEVYYERFLERQRRRDEAPSELGDEHRGNGPSDDEDNAEGPELGEQF